VRAHLARSWRAREDEAEEDDESEEEEPPEQDAEAGSLASRSARRDRSREVEEARRGALRSRRLRCYAGNTHDEDTPLRGEAREAKEAQER